MKFFTKELWNKVNDESREKRLVAEKEWKKMCNFIINSLIR